jgi:hypothetical protein
MEHTTKAPTLEQGGGISVAQGVEDGAVGGDSDKVGAEHAEGDDLLYRLVLKAQQHHGGQEHSAGGRGMLCKRIVEVQHQEVVNNASCHQHGDDQSRILVDFGNLHGEHDIEDPDEQKAVVTNDLDLEGSHERSIRIGKHNAAHGEEFQERGTFLYSNHPQ